MALSRREFLKMTAVAAVVGTNGSAAARSQPAGAGVIEMAEPEHRVFTVPNLDPAHDGLRVAQLSDIHVGVRTPPERIRDAIAMANAFEPDLVVLTGDYLSREEQGVGLMRELMGGLSAPTFAVLGNHDHWVDARGATGALTALGYEVLCNENTTLTLRGAPFTIIGIDDRLTGNAAPERAFAGAGRSSRLVLAHGPRTADDLAALGEPLLCLSGHTHGGQIHIPGVTPLVLRAFANEPYDQGAFQVGPVQLYVNRGVGNAALRFRINAAPEVTLAVLRRAKAI
jgi:uncharacterized protein